jgi:hypothetical protein
MHRTASTVSVRPNASNGLHSLYLSFPSTRSSFFPFCTPLCRSVILLPLPFSTLLVSSVNRPGADPAANPSPLPSHSVDLATERADHGATTAYRASFAGQCRCACRWSNPWAVGRVPPLPCDNGKAALAPDSYMLRDSSEPWASSLTRGQPREVLDSVVQGQWQATRGRRPGGSECLGAGGSAQDLQRASPSCALLYLGCSSYYVSVHVASVNFLCFRCSRRMFQIFMLMLQR